MNDKEFRLFEQYKGSLTPEEQLHKLLNDEVYQEKERLYRMRLLEEYDMKFKSKSNRDFIEQG